MERVISSPSRPKDPLVRCQFSGGKYPHFSGLACISNPFSLPTLWLSKPLSSQCSLHNTACANTTSEPSGGEFWLCSQRLVAMSHGESSPGETFWGVTALLKALWALYWRGKLSSGWEQQRVGTLLLSLKLCDGIPDGPDSKGPMQVFSFTIKKSLYKSMWLFALSILLCALLNTAEDTAGLDPKTVNAIYDLAEEVVSVLHVLLALAWI